MVCTAGFELATRCTPYKCAALSDSIKRATAQHHGLVGRAFLEKVTRNTRDFCAMLEKINSLQMFSVEGAAAQDKRAAGRFAFIGLAGELATEYGLTGWQEVEAPKPRESDHPR